MAKSCSPQLRWRPTLVESATKPAGGTKEKRHRGPATLQAERSRSASRLTRLTAPPPSGAMRSATVSANARESNRTIARRNPTTWRAACSRLGLARESAPIGGVAAAVMVSDAPAESRAALRGWPQLTRAPSRNATGHIGGFICVNLRRAAWRQCSAARLLMIASVASFTDSLGSCNKRQAPGATPFRRRGVGQLDLERVSRSHRALSATERGLRSLYTACTRTCRAFLRRRSSDPACSGVARGMPSAFGIARNRDRQQLVVSGTQ